LDRRHSFPEDIQKTHLGETLASECLSLLQELHANAHISAQLNGEKTKQYSDKKMASHLFHIGDKVLIANDFYATKNSKLVPNWRGLAEIIDISDTNVKVQIGHNIKVLNISKLKHFYTKNMNI
jgi:hypothetical protein